MKIALINNLYKPYQKGGAERIVEIMKEELSELGHDVFIICTRPKERKDGEENKVYYLPSAYSQLSEHSFLFRLIWQMVNLVNYSKFKAILKILNLEKPDLVITNNLMGLGLLTPLAIYKSGAKHLHVLHDIQLLHPSGLMYFGQEKILRTTAAKIYQKISKFLFSLSPKAIIISPSNWLLKTHLDCGLWVNNQNFIINNPLPEKEEIKLIKEKTFIFVGQLEWHKGLDLFIKVAPYFPDYKFKIIGDGSSLKEIKNNKTANLEILGRQDGKKVFELIARSSALIIPSRCYENSPTVIYEAYSVETPSIAANLGGIPELIEKFGGLLFETDNLESLKKAITEFISNGTNLKVVEKYNYSKTILEKIK